MKKLKYNIKIEGFESKIEINNKLLYNIKFIRLLNSKIFIFSNK